MSRRSQIALFWCFLLVFSIVYSKFLLTLSMIGLLATSMFNVEDNAWKMSLNTAFFKNAAAHKIWFIMSLPFWIVLMSGFYSQDISYWLDRLNMRLPFLVLPLAFANLPPFTTRQYYSVFYFLLMLMVFSLAVTLTHYALDFEAINNMIEHGKSMPTPMNHIRYSLLLAISILSGVVLYIHGFRFRYAWERPALLAALIFQFIGIHVLSVRSGLAVLYVAIGVLMLIYIVQSKRYVFGALVLLGLGCLPLATYFVLPSFKAKVNYAFYDRQMRAEGRVKDFSDSERIASLEVGMTVAKENLLIGVGTGDVWWKIREEYARNYAWETEPKIPHNEFIMILAGTGLLGFVLFVWAFLYPLWFQDFYREPIFLAHGICLFLSYLVESTIEVAIGTAIYIFFATLCVHYQKNNLKTTIVA
jgi:O-antigen ligase